MNVIKTFYSTFKYFGTADIIYKTIIIEIKTKIVISGSDNL